MAQKMLDVLGGAAELIIVRIPGGTEVPPKQRNGWPTTYVNPMRPSKLRFSLRYTSRLPQLLKQTWRGTPRIKPSSTSVWMESGCFMARGALR